ncbi:hypothetical protein ACP70R_003818 [Stipagrostis hirtigluma subsp. patula]
MATHHVAVVLLAVAAALASPRRLGNAAAVAASGRPRWHIVGVTSLLTSTFCTAAKGVDATWLKRAVKGKQVRADGPWAEKGERRGLAPMYHARPKVINMVCKKSKSVWRRNGAKTVSGKVKATSRSRKRGGPGAEPKYFEATRAEDEARTCVGVKGVAWRLRGAVRSGS